MPKKDGGPNKSQAIRDYYTANPNAKPMEVAAALKDQGIDVTPPFVSTVRSTSLKKKGLTRKRSANKPGPKPATNKTLSKRGGGRKSASTTKVASAKAGTNGEVSFDSLLKVKQIVEEIGGVDDARAALTALEKLID